MGQPTLFQSIAAGDTPSHKVAEGELWYAFLDIFPRTPGHTLVVPRTGKQHLSDLTKEERDALFEGVSIVQLRLSALFQTDDFTVCVHDGPLAGQEVPHVHVHVLPRIHSDGGKTLQAMWPRAPPMGGDSDHVALGQLATTLRGA
ncbi:MAG: HIT family protein [Candidatus Poseidoniaceae archaeon]|nr:HIT family protein [Candidatus Poseidoniaceae archaeon]